MADEGKNYGVTIAIVVLLLVALWWWFHNNCATCQAAAAALTAGSSPASPSGPTYTGPVTRVLQTLNTGGFLQILVPGAGAAVDVANLPPDAIVSYLNSAEQPATPTGAQTNEISQRFPGVSLSTPAQLALVSQGSFTIA